MTEARYVLGGHGMDEFGGGWSLTACGLRGWRPRPRLGRSLFEAFATGIATGRQSIRRDGAASISPHVGKGGYPFTYSSALATDTKARSAHAAPMKIADCLTETSPQERA